MLKPQKKYLYLLSNMLTFCYLVLFSTILLYTFYRFNFFPDNISDRYLKYFVISILGVIFFLTLFFFKKKIRLLINILSLCIIILVGLFEIILDNLELPKGHLSEKLIAAKKLNINYDRRSGERVLNDLHKQDVDIVKAVYPQSFNLTNGISENIFPLAGISNKKTLHCNETGEWKSHLSDRYGFSNLDYIWDEDNIDYLVVGDQFSQGACVDLKNNIPSNIEKFTGKKIINLSMVGNGPLLKLASLKEYGKKIKPKKVLWFYYEGNDLIDELPREKQSKILLNYLNPGFTQSLTEKQEILDSKLQEHIDKDQLLWETKIFRLYNLRSLLKFDSEHIDYKVNIDPLYNSILEEAKRFVKLWDGKIEFIYIPQFERYKKNIEDNWEKNKIISLVKKLNIRIIDLDEGLIKKDSDPLSYYPLKMHGTFIAKANKNVAKYITDIIIRH